MVTEKYLCYEKDGVINPFMHIKQKNDGELCFRFLNVSSKPFDFHYTRHNREFHAKTSYEGIQKEKIKTGIRKTTPVFSIDNLERIQAMIITDSTASRKPLEKIKKIPQVMSIEASLYPKGLINMIIYLNPNMPISKIICIAKPIQFIQDQDFKPSLVILCFPHSKDFLKLGVDMI